MLKVASHFYFLQIKNMSQKVRQIVQKDWRQQPCKPGEVCSFNADDKSIDDMKNDLVSSVANQLTGDEDDVRRCNALLVVLGENLDFLNKGKQANVVDKVLDLENELFGRGKQRCKVRLYTEDHTKNHNRNGQFIVTVDGAEFNVFFPSITHVDIGGEGLIKKTSDNSLAPSSDTYSGFKDAANVNVQTVQSGRTDQSGNFIPIPNLIKLNSWDDPIPLSSNSVPLVTFQNAPVTEHMAREAARIVTIGGRIELWVDPKYKNMIDLIIKLTGEKRGAGTSTLTTTSDPNQFEVKQTITTSVAAQRVETLNWSMPWCVLEAGNLRVGLQDQNITLPTPYVKWNAAYDLFGKTKPAVIFVPGVYFNNVEDGSKSGQAVKETDTVGGRGLRPSQAIDGGSESEPTWPLFLAVALFVALIVLKTKH